MGTPQKTLGSFPLGRIARHLFLGTACALAATSGGCVWNTWHLFGKPDDPDDGPADSMVMHGDRLESGAAQGPSKAAKSLAAAQELFRQGDYEKAEKKFHDIADNKKNSETIAEEARYYEAECLRCQGKYPSAADTYHKLIIDFPSGAHHVESGKRMFDIANFWLDDTREEMRAEREKREGKRSWVMPASFVHWEKSKPLLDEQGRAIELLEQVNYNDITSPLAAEALFLEGSVKFYNEDYREADRLFSQLVEMHPESKYVTKALELGIISKHMSTGGSDYDGRKAAEARQMVYMAQAKYPELAGPKSDFLERQLRGITQQQAEKDLKIAEFYRRTGHPGAAYFCYEVVRRRYPGTPFFDKATERMHELAADKKNDDGKGPPAVPPPPVPSPAGTEAAPMPRPVRPGTLPDVPEMAPAPRPVSVQGR